MSNPWDRDTTQQKPQTQGGNPWDRPPTPQIQPNAQSEQMQQPQQAQPTMGQEIQQQWTQPGKEALTGVQQLASGDPRMIPAGAANIGMGGVHTILAPINSALTLLKNANGLPGAPPGANLGPVISLLEQGMGAVGDFFKGHGENATKFLTQPVLGKEGSEALATPVGEASSLASQALLGKVADVGLGKVKEGLTPEARVSQAETLLQRAAPVKKGDLNRSANVQRAAPYISEQVRQTPFEKTQDPTNMRQAMGMVERAQDHLWNTKYKPLINANKDAPVDGAAIAQKVMSSDNEYLQKIEPGRSQEIQDYANQYNKPITLGEADKFLKGLNADLKEYYKKTPDQQQAAATKGAPIAAKSVAADALRESINSTLERYGVKNVGELRKDYGSLASIHKDLRDNVVRSERPRSLSPWAFRAPIVAGVGADVALQHLGVPPGVATMGGLAAGAVLETLKLKNAPNSAILRAFNKLSKANLTPRAVENAGWSPRGLLPPATPQLGSQVESPVNTQTGFYPPMQRNVPQLGAPAIPLGSQMDSPMRVSTGAFPPEMEQYIEAMKRTGQ